MNTLFYSFTIGSILATIVLFFVYFLKKISKNDLQQIFSVNLILLLTTCIFTLLQIEFSEILNIKPIYFAYFYYIGILFFPVSLYFTVKIFINTKIKFKFKDALLFVIPLLCLFGLWTNEKTNLFFVNYDTNLNNCSFGPLFIVNEIYSYLLYFITIIQLIKFFKENSELFTEQLKLFLIGITFPFILNLLGVLKIIEVTIYIAPISSAVSLICFALALYKFQIIDRFPIALSKIVDRISDGYVVLNEKNIIINSNKTFSKIFKIEDITIDSLHIFDLLTLKNFKELDEKYLIGALKSVRDSNEILILEKEFKNINKYLRLEVNSLKSQNAFIGSLILVKDITEHKQDLEKIKTNQNILIEKERMASLGQMISGVAHNLKTPIFSITGATEGLLDLVKEYNDSITDPSVTIDDHKEISKEMNIWLEKIKGYTSYMSDIITTIRGQAASFTETTFETFTIQELIKRVEILMKHELQQALVSLNISYNLTKEVNLQGNINNLIQILNNLISNSIQAYEGKPNQEINLNIENTRNTVKITITDYGCGIAPEIKEKLFNEIITTKGNNGTGLGLFMSYTNIKTQFNGDLKFDSKVGKGTSFEITLPILEN